MEAAGDPWMVSAPDVYVLAGRGEPDRAERALAERLGLGVRAADEAEAKDLLLAIGDEGLELRSGDAPSRRGARVDFRARALTDESRRRPGRLTRAQPLPRAIGRRTRSVLDATAGFGDDAIALASLGYLVTAVERSPIVAALLEDARERALQDAALLDVARRLTVHCADARDWLRRAGEPPDAIYIDPMFPPKRRASALPRLQIQLLRRLVGDDPDAEGLVAAALARGARRVVIKRPLRAPALAGTPSESHSGKLVRYDVHHGAFAGRTANDSDDA
jgi:16S rRNA (guanine1516-N2)-methyltransferase